MRVIHHHWGGTQHDTTHFHTHPLPSSATAHDIARLEVIDREGPAGIRLAARKAEGAPILAAGSHLRSRGNWKNQRNQNGENAGLQPSKDGQKKSGHVMNDNMFQYGLDMNDMNRNHFDTLTHLNPYIEIKKKGRKFREIPSRAQPPACGTPEAPSAQLAPTLKLGSSLDST
jgi:hypothetical protein